MSFVDDEIAAEAGELLERSATALFGDDIGPPSVECVPTDTYLVSLEVEVTDVPPGDAAIDRLAPLGWQVAEIEPDYELPPADERPLGQLSFEQELPTGIGATLISEPATRAPGSQSVSVALYQR